MKIWKKERVKIRKSKEKKEKSKEKKGKARKILKLIQKFLNFSFIFKFIIKEKSFIFKFRKI